MKVLHSTFSLSRNGGGVTEVIREITRPTSGVPNEHLVIGPQMYCDEVSDTWHCATRGYEVSGPRSLGFSREVSQLYHEFAPDVCHIHGLWMYYSRANYRSCSKKKTPYLISPHGMLDRWAVRNSRWKKRIVGWLYENAHLNGASVIHALCEAEADEIRHFGLNGRIEIIPNGVSFSATVDVEPPWHDVIDGSRRVLLYLGRLHPKKGLLEFLESWKDAVSQPHNRDWFLAICGWNQGTYANRLINTINSLELTEHAKLLGPVFDEKKLSAFQNCCAFVLPSKSEGLPIAVLEAWAAAKPTLLTRECNLPSGIQAGAATMLPTPPAKCSHALLDFLTLGDSAHQEMGKAGRDIVERKFQWSRIISQYSDLYASLIRN